MNGCLTLDIGNTNASLAFVSFVDGGAARRQAAGAYRVGDLHVEALGAWSGDEGEAAWLEQALRSAALRSAAEPTNGLHAGISAVGSHEREGLLAEQLRSAGWNVQTRPDAGLVMEIRHPETCGTDRQYAIRAALDDQLHQRQGKAEPARVLVIDAGTALTVDAGIARPWDRKGPASMAGRAAPSELVFLGGAIAMGPGSLASAITARGARLAKFEVDPDAPALGRSTVEALRAGVSVGFRGAVRELCLHVSEEAFGGTSGVAAYLTGGARAFAREAVSGCFSGGFHESAHLVHVGLARAVRGAMGRTEDAS
ncbi:MAG: pantothenate kinase type III [Planctomycetota bacterium]